MKIAYSKYSGKIKIMLSTAATLSLNEVVI
jgi:hypothetical protein